MSPREVPWIGLACIVQLHRTMPSRPSPRVPAVVLAMSLSLSLAAVGTSCAGVPEGTPPLSDWASSSDDGKSDIFGSDGRRDPSDPEVASWIRDAAQAVGGFVPVEDGAHLRADGSLTLGELTVAERNGLCPDVAFVDERETAVCTVFLVAPDLAITAAHCTHGNECWDMPIVFGLDHAMAERGSVAADDVYYCAEIVDSNRFREEDWALMRLDREAHGLTPLTLRSGANAREGEAVIGIGHPSGLPLKVSLGGTVLHVRDEAFTSDLDLFGGSSGGPILSEETGEVVGILFAGGPDYVYDEARDCTLPLQCESLRGAGLACQGAHSTNVSRVRGLPGVPDVPGAGDHPRVERCEYECLDYGYRLLECVDGWQCLASTACIEMNDCTP